MGIVEDKSHQRYFGVSLDIIAVEVGMAEEVVHEEEGGRGAVLVFVFEVEAREA